MNLPQGYTLDTSNSLPAGYTLDVSNQPDPNDAIKSYGGGLERGAAATAMLLPNLVNGVFSAGGEAAKLAYPALSKVAPETFPPLSEKEIYSVPNAQPLYGSEDVLKMLPASMQPHNPTTAGGAIAGMSGNVMGGVLAGTSPRSMIMNNIRDTEASRLGKILTDNDVPTYLSDVLPAKSNIKSTIDLLGDLPFSGKAARAEARQTGLNSAIAKEIGMGSDVVNPPLMGKASDQSSDVFKYVGDNYNIAKPQTASLLNDLAVTQGNLSKLDPNSARPLNYHINDILDKVSANGEIPGVAYTQVRADLGRLARSTTDPQVEQGAYAIQKQLDAAMQPSIAPDMQKVFSNNREYYRNMLALEPSVTKNVTSGNIDPASLQSGVAKIFPNYEYNDPASLPQLTQGAQLLRPNLQANPVTPMQKLVKQYGWGGDAAQMALLAGSPALGPMSRVMNPKLNPSDFNPDMTKALARALMATSIGSTGGKN